MELPPLAPFPPMVVRESTIMPEEWELCLESCLKNSELLKALIGDTPLLLKMRTHISGKEAGRARSLMESFATFEKTPNGRPKRPVRRKIDKGKGRDTSEYGHGAMENAHVHKLSLVSQVQDLFPDLGSAFIVKLLDEYDDDTAVVTDHLLNNSLPTHLSQADRSKQLSPMPHHHNHDLAPGLEPLSTPPLLPTRRNIHDDDEFDRLAVDVSKIRLGKSKEVTADNLLASERSTSQKAAIISALAAFDSDDDERDDTYDAEDVGGTIDNTNDDNAADLRQELHEETLFNAYTTSPDVFNRDAETRRGKARAALKSETGMTDEAIEGWAIMIGRDPRRLKRLEVKFETAGSRQAALQGAAWRGDSGTEETEDSDAGGASRGGRGGKGRGRGRGGENPRGGRVTGESGDKGTQVARQRKDANKGSRANHNRRDQRARKMARGGFPG
ncbi:activating signal cointegrator complex subunit 2, partial [Lecanoromycetidae sp. Uapishka_2]